MTAGPETWSGPLILRLLSPAHDPRRALRERAVQNSVAAQGYPVPRVLTACADPGPLGAGFLVMERALGRPLLEARRAGVGRVLAATQARLHALDPEPLRRALDEEGRAAGGGFDRDVVGFEHHLRALERQIDRVGLDGLRDGMRWLVARRPATASPAICHGDFHPLNVLAADGRVTAVLDWPNAVVTAPEYDVASTHVLLSAVPIALLPVAAVLRPVVAALRRVLLARYLAVYRRLRPLDTARMPYFEAAAGLARPGALDASTFGERLAALFARVTGVPVALPPRRG